MPFVLHAMAVPVKWRNLELNLIMHQPTQKEAYLVDNHLLGIPIYKIRDWTKNDIVMGNIRIYVWPYMGTHPHFDHIMSTECPKY